MPGPPSTKAAAPTLKCGEFGKREGTIFLVFPMNHFPGISLGISQVPNFPVANIAGIGLPVVVVVGCMKCGQDSG